MQDLQDTIVAIATPPGRGGIGIVRLSGPRALALATPLLALTRPLEPARARFTRILDLEPDDLESHDPERDDQERDDLERDGLGSPATPRPLDEAVVTWFAAPHSYTAEDVVEIAAHGAPVLLDYLLRATLARGARLAEPGEFTQRAFLAGRLDLSAAEAVNDLIHASTLHQARIAAAQLGGSLARALGPVKQRLIALIAQLEAGVDFAEDDLDLLPPAELLPRLAAIRQPLQALADTYAYGRIVHAGFTLALVGRPNAGKSSLFNRLLGKPRAIVTAQPGTTRDPIAETLSIAGIPVQLVDTAGLRDVPPGEEAEAAGVARTRTHMAEADLILHILDATEPDATEPDATNPDATNPDATNPHATTPDATTPDATNPDATQPHATADPLHPQTTATQTAIAARPHLTVLNKADLLPAAANPNAAHPNAILTSALTGQGIDQLREAILRTLTRHTPAADTALITSLRQDTALTAALTALAAAAEAAALPHEFLLLDLHTALDALDSLTGATTPDDILHLIFSTFCIGK